MCECGHPLNAHGDRAVFPHCEGNDPNLHVPLMRKLEGSDFTWVSTPTPRRGEPCMCGGFRHV